MPDTPESFEHRLLVERSALLESAADGIYSIDREGRCTFVNRAFTRMLGFTPEECLGKDVHQLIHARKPDGTPYPVEECPIYRCVTTGEGARVDDEVAWHKDGTPIPVEYSTQPVIIKGNVDAAVITMRDITAQRRAQEDLAASERRLRLALTAGRMGTWLLNGRTNRLHWDEALERIYGLESGTFGGSLDSLLALVHPDDRDRLLQQLNAAGLEGSDHFETDYRILRADGEVRWIDERGQVLFDHKGRKLAISGVSWDSTVRRRGEQELRASEARTRAMLETALDAIVSTDRDGRITEFNASAERTFGYKREDVLGKLLPEVIIPPSYHEAHARGMKHFYETGEGPVLGNRIEVSGMRADGSEFPVELAVNRISTGGEAEFTAYLRDITARRQQEEDLKAARDAAEEANQAKSQFLASMSHELRTPLNAIIGYSEMLQEEAVEAGAASLRDDLQKIHTAGRHLLELINDVLDLSKIEAGRMELYEETFDIAEAVRSAAETIQHLAQKNNDSLVVDCPPDIGAMHTDLTKLRQSLLNLLSNACKFTENGTVTLQVRRYEKAGDGWLAFAVSDTGIGISDDQIERLFEPFSQADASTSRRFGGTGLGLTLSRRFCRLMGGDLTAFGNPGVGSTFTINLPAKGVTVPEEAQAASTTWTAESEAILVVDDDATARDLLRRTLEREGFRVALATNGREALEMARKLRPTAVTLDVMMPGLDGWTVLAQLKADPETCDIPVIMVTMLEDRSLAYSLGANDYLTKPIDRERLVSILRKHHCGKVPCPVLVVEDDPNSRHLMRTILEREKWKVDEAANGAEALKLLNQNSYELILLDLMMPEMDGFEFVTEMRRNPVWAQIPVIVLTAKDLTEEDRSRLNGRVRQIISKGRLNREGLRTEIERVLGSRGIANRSVAPNV